MKQCSGNLIVLNHFFNGIERIGNVKIICGKIQRDRDQRQTVIHAITDQPAYLFQNIAIQAVDQLCIFKYRNENIRKDHPILRVFPACQCFKAAEVSIQSPDNRLKKHFDIMFFQCFAEIAQHIVLFGNGFSHGRAVERDAAVSIFHDAVAGNFSRIKAMPQRLQRILFLRQIDSRLQLNAIVMDIAVDFPAYRFQLCLQIRRWQQRRKMICGQMADQCSRKTHSDGFRNFLQAKISPLHAIQPVVFLKAGQIQDDGAECPHFRKRLQIFCPPECLLKEFMHAQNTRFIFSDKIAGDLFCRQDQKDVGLSESGLSQRACPDCLAEMTISGPVLKRKREVLRMPGRKQREWLVILFLYQILIVPGAELQEGFRILAFIEQRSFPVCKDDSLTSIR